MAEGHIETEILEALLNRVKAVTFLDEPIVLEHAFSEATFFIWYQPCCSFHVRKAFQAAKDAVFKHTDPRHISTKQAKQLTYLSALAMDLFSSKARTQDAVLRDAWESAAWEVVSLAAFSTPELGCSLIKNRDTMEWVKNVFCSRELCPNPQLRLEIMRFLSWWTDDAMVDPILGNEVLNALVQLTPHLSLHDLLPRGRPSLSGSFLRLLQDFDDKGLLPMVASRARTQIRDFTVNDEARFFARVVKLQCKKAKALHYKYQSGSLRCSVVMEEYRYLLEMLLLLVSFTNLFKQAGLNEATATTVAATITNLFKCSSSMVVADKESFRKLTEQVNKLLHMVWLENPNLMAELRSRHGKKLKLAVRQAAKVRLPLQHLSRLQAYKVPEDIPVQFLDAVTGEIMEEPLQILPLDIVVDRSTVVGSLLFSASKRNVDSFSFIPLEELELEISSWKVIYNTFHPHNPLARRITD